MWPRTLNRAIQTLFILLLAYYTLIGGFVAGVREYPWRITTEIITLLMLGGWLIVKLIRKEDLRPTPLDLPMAGLILASSLSAAFSTDPRVSWENFLLNILFALLFYFTLELILNANHKNKLINAILVIGGVIAAIGLVEFWQWYGGQLVSDINWRSTGLTLRFEDALRIKSVLHSPNYLAYYLLAVLGLSLGKVANAGRWWQRIGWLSYALLVLTALILTRSRGGSLAVLVIFASFLGLVWANRSKTHLIHPAKSLQFVSTTAVILILAALFIWIFVGRTSLTSILAADRADFWLASLKMARDHPLTGVGAGTYPAQYLLYRDLSRGAAYIITHAHNVWFTVIAEYGLLGFSAAIWTVVVFARAVRQSFKQPLARTDFIWLAAAIAALLGQGVHNLFDDFLEFPVFTWYTIFLGTLCLEPQPAPVEVGASQTWPRRALWAAGAGVVIALGAVWFNRGFAVYHQAVQASNEANWPQTAAWLEQAVALDPPNKFYRQQLALSYGWLAYGDPGFLPGAVAAQQQVIEQKTTYPLDYAHLACLRWAQGDAAAAIAAMTHAAQTEAPLSTYAGLKSWHTSQTTYRFNLGYYYESAGDVAQAQEQYQLSILQRPEIAASIFWQQTPQRAQIIQSILAEIKRQGLSPNVLYFGGDYQGLFELSRAKLSDTPDDPFLLLLQARALSALGQKEQARLPVNEMADRNSINSSPIYVDLIAETGDLAEIEKAVQTAAVWGGQSSSPIIYYHWGQLAEAQNDLAEAKRKYQEAIFRATAIDTDYANLIGRRLPLSQEKMPCLLLPFARQELSAPSLRLAALYQAEGDFKGARKVYENLLLYEPYNPLARQQLEQLCQSQAGLCDSPGPGTP